MHGGVGRGIACIQPCKAEAGGFRVGAQPGQLSSLVRLCLLSVCVLRIELIVSLEVQFSVQMVGKDL